MRVYQETDYKIEFVERAVNCSAHIAYGIIQYIDEHLDPEYGDDGWDDNALRDHFPIVFESDADVIEHFDRLWNDFRAGIETTLEVQSKFVDHLITEGKLEQLNDGGYILPQSSIPQYQNEERLKSARTHVQSALRMLNDCVNDPDKLKRLIDFADIELELLAQSL